MALAGPVIGCWRKAESKALTLSTFVVLIRQCAIPSQAHSTEASLLSRKYHAYAIIYIFQIKMHTIKIVDILSEGSLEEKKGVPEMFSFDLVIVINTK